MTQPGTTDKALTDTPRTDAAIATWASDPLHDQRDKAEDFARQLERELDAALRFSDTMKALADAGTRSADAARLDGGIVKSALIWGMHKGVVERGEYERVEVSGAFDLNTIAEYLNGRLAAVRPSSATTPRTINGIKLVKALKDQRDEAAHVLRTIMAKLREESGSTDPMEAFSYDASWEALAKEADAVLEKCPSYTVQLQRICDGIGITREELEAALGVQGVKS